MVGFSNVKAIVDAYEEGRYFDGCVFRKVPGASQASVAKWWVDLSMTSGNPLPNYYIGNVLEATALDGSRGLFHGANKAPATKHLSEVCLITPSAGLVGEYRLLDYVLYYPFIDLDDLDPQVAVNPIGLSRYESGALLQAMLVAVTPTVGGGTFTFDYVNQDGVTRTAPIQSCSVAVANIASIVTSEPATAAGGRIFLRLADGDYGIRSLVSWTNLTPNGGLGALVLVRPLTVAIPVREINVPVEVELFKDYAKLPLVPDGAYLHFIMKCSASIASTTLAGRCEFVWSR